LALTVRTNGSTITASWFNDYYNLLTGVMADQPVTITNTLISRGVFSVKNASSVVKAKINQNGSVSFDGGLITTDGLGNITAASILLPQGVIKYINWGSVSVPTAGLTVVHNLGVIPTAILIQTQDTVLDFAVTILQASVTTTQFVLGWPHAGSLDVWWLAIA
jgi:hypothetical protein